MNAGAKGVKIICSGRLAGSEMARKETQKLGSIPLHTLDANVDYAVATARTTYGAIGIKTWIYKGKFGEEIAPSHYRRQRRLPKRVGPAMRGRGGDQGEPKQESAVYAEPQVTAPPSEPGKGESNSTDAS